MSESKPVIGIIQARMGSKRLPGKVLKDIGGEPMLVRVVERAQRASTLDRVVVATSVDPQDDPIHEVCESCSYQCYRGEPLDLLDRYYQAAKEYGANAIVRITADCPMIDPAVIDQTVRAFLVADPPLDFVANRLPRNRTYPIGMDTEICSYKALEQAWREADQPYQREHVMPYLYEVEDRFRVAIVESDVDLSHHRWTVDTDEDLEFVRAVYDRFDNRDDFTMDDVLQLLAAEPELMEINREVRHKGMWDVDEDLG